MVDNSDMNYFYGFKHSWNLVTHIFVVFRLNYIGPAYLIMVDNSFSKMSLFVKFYLKLRMDDMSYKTVQILQYSCLNGSFMLLDHTDKVYIPQILYNLVDNDI